MISLRYYQQEAVNAVYEFLQQKPDLNPCVVLPTGAGKSIVIGRIVADAVDLWNGRCLILAHVKELLEQNAAKIRNLLPDVSVGIFSAGLNRRDTKNQVVVGGIQSVYNKAADLGAFDLILIDEAHLIPLDGGESMYQTFLKAAKEINSNVRLIGFTATPYRLKGGLICKKENLLNEICYEISVRELIAHGFLSSLKSKAGRNRADLSGLHIRAGEFITDEVAAKMDNARLVAAAVTEMLELTAERKKVLIFASSVLHAKHIKEEIEAKTKNPDACGIVIGDTGKEDRAETLARFQGSASKDLFGNDAQDLKYLVNVGVLTTGFDAPAVDCVVLLRPTASPGLYYQMVGRGFRLSPETGKTDCMILDYGQNIMRHGPVDHIQADFEKQREKKGTAPMRECPKCQAVFLAARRSCPDCGYELPRQDGKLHHGAQAASVGILSGEVIETRMEVRQVIYSKHRKKNAPDAPPTLRVEYQIGFADWISEWICPEHTGYARKKAEKWWDERSKDGSPLPDRVEICIEAGQNGRLEEPVAIILKQRPGDKYPSISSYDFTAELGTITEAEAQQLATLQIAEAIFQAKQGATWIDLDGDPDEIAERLAITAENEEETYSAADVTEYYDAEAECPF